jgi:uncharacterized protein (UPF0335 family)
MSKAMIMSSFKSTIERIRALETERKNLLLEIEELKRMADAKAKALESEINMLRDDVKSLRLLLSGEEMDAELGQKKKR